MQARAVHSENHARGRRRLRIFMGGLGGGACAAAMAVILVFYGTPYNAYWWPVMAAVLLGAAVVSALCAPVIEWVIAGYLASPDER